MYNECRKYEKEEVITTAGAEVRSRRAPYRVRSDGSGRPPAPPSDIVMFLVLKTLFCDSYRGTYSLLAADSTVVMLDGMTTVPHYNMARKYCSRISENFLQSLMHSITVVLRKCRRLNIAGDGTGFGTRRYLCWFVPRKAGKKRKRQFVFFCRELDLFGGELIGIDSTKLRAVNSFENNVTKAVAEKKISEIDSGIDRYIRDMEREDELEERQERRESPGKDKAARGEEGTLLKDAR